MYNIYPTIRAFLLGLESPSAFFPIAYHTPDKGLIFNYDFLRNTSLNPTMSPHLCCIWYIHGIPILHFYYLTSNRSRKTMTFFKSFYFISLFSDTFDLHGSPIWYLSIIYLSIVLFMHDNILLFHRYVWFIIIHLMPKVLKNIMSCFFHTWPALSGNLFPFSTIDHPLWCFLLAVFMLPVMNELCIFLLTCTSKLFSSYMI